MRAFLWSLLHTRYQLHVVGEQNIPRTGPVLFVSNHLSYVDPLLISACTPVPIRFLMWRDIYEWSGMRWFFRMMKAIPISPKDGPRRIAESLSRAREALQAGDRVGIFSEGSISRIGFLRSFQRGMEYVVKKTDAVIVPVFLDNIWGSIFSFKGGRFFWKWPNFKRRRVTVSFGAPLSASTSTATVRDHILDMASTFASTTQIWRREHARDISYPFKKHPEVACIQIPDVTTADETQWGRRPGTVGRPLPGIHIRTVNSEGVPQPPGVVGLLQAKGAALATKGWINLDECGSVDNEGFVKLGGV